MKFLACVLFICKVAWFGAREDTFYTARHCQCKDVSDYKRMRLLTVQYQIRHLESVVSHPKYPVNYPRISEYSESSVM